MQHQTTRMRSVVGEVVDISCWMKDGLRGDGHRRCAEMCGESGLPMGILEKRKGRVTLFIAFGTKAGEPINKALLPHVSETVRVKGQVTRKSGCYAIWIESIEQVPSKQ